MDETVISWNLPNVISIIFMLMIIWIVFGMVGHFVFRQGSSSNTVAITTTPETQVLGV